MNKCLYFSYNYNKIQFLKHFLYFTFKTIDVFKLSCYTSRFYLTASFKQTGENNLVDVAFILLFGYFCRDRQIRSHTVEHSLNIFTHHCIYSDA